MTVDNLRRVYPQRSFQIFVVYMGGKGVNQSFISAL